MGTQSKYLKDRALRSVKWSVLGEVFARGVQPVTLLVLARLLTPSDFGVVGIATIAIGVAEIFQDFGLGKTLIQREGNVEHDSTQVFWLNTLVSCSLYALIFTAAPAIAAFFKAPGSVLILRVLCLRVLVTGVTAVQTAILQRNLEFRKLFVARCANTFLPGIISIPMALAGFGVWALVWGSLAGSAMQSLIMWLTSTWRPSWSINLQIWVQLFRFSKWILLEGLLSAVIQLGDSTIVGHYLGLRDLGLYRMSLSCVGMVMALFFTPLQPVAYSFLSRLQANPEEIGKYYLKGTQIISTLALPLGAGLAMTGPGFLLAFLGAQWIGAEPVFIFSAARLSLDGLVGLNSSAFTAFGRPDLNAKILFAVSLFSVPAFVIAAPAGLLVFCVVRFLAAGLDNAISYIVLVRTLAIRYRALWTIVRENVACTVFMIFSVLLLRYTWNGLGIFHMATYSLTGIIAYSGSQLLINRPYVKTLTTLASRLIRGDRASITSESQPLT